MRTIKQMMCAVGVVGALLLATHAAAMTIFSEGDYGVPETISLVPDGFRDDLTGSYFIPDALTSNIWVVPAGGGAPTPFLPAPVEEVGYSIVGGTFLPAGWGDNSGKFLTASFSLPSILTIDSAGGKTSFGTIPQSLFTTPLIAPSAFAPYGGHLFVTDQNNTIWRADPAGGGLTVFRSFQGGPFEAIDPFGIEFTPPSWGGTFGNRMLVSDTFASVDNGPGTRASYIVAVSVDGTASLFATVPLKDNPVPGARSQDGLRQMVMAPNDYFKVALGIPGELLLVSVSGSRNGGGVLGDILALDSDGAIVASLRDNLGLTDFDPRGMLFTADGNLLIADTSTTDPIWNATAGDFQRASAPAPATLALMALGLAGLGFSARKQVLSRHCATADSAQAPGAARPGGRMRRRGSPIDLDQG